MKIKKIYFLFLVFVIFNKKNIYIEHFLNLCIILNHIDNSYA